MPKFSKRYDRSLSFGDNLRGALIRAIQEIGDDIFYRSQRKVPVDTGTLKKSGYIEYLDDGVRIGYRAPYALFVEKGFQGQYIFVRSHRVSAHTRRTAKVSPVWEGDFFVMPKQKRRKKFGVREHRRRSYFRHEPNGRAGKFFLRDSTDEVFESGKAMGTVIKSILATLSKYGRTVKK